MLVNANSLHIPLADASVQMVACSPPYWGLRQYLTGDNKHHELGAEAVPDCLGWATGSECGECFVCHLVQVGRELWRVMRDDGCWFLNLGDSYAGGKGQSGSQGAEKQEKRNKNQRSINKGYQTLGGKKETKPTDNIKMLRESGLKPKDLCMIPARVALALQADGWYLRSEIIWAKPNPMPESVTDRPTRSHEVVYLLAKSQRYYYDAEAVKEASVDEESYKGRRVRNAPTMAAYDLKNTKNAGSIQDDGKLKSGMVYEKRNRRDVWTVATESYSGSHFATWPTKLVEPMILAGTSAAGCCPKCGAAWERMTEREDKRHWTERNEYTKTSRYALGDNGSGRNDGRADFKPAGLVTSGWQPACTCPAHEPVPCIILDPFAGSGTTGQVARLHGRRFIGLDLSAKYLAELAMPRAENTNTASSMATLPLFA